jgi:hypothetical protein
MQLLILLVEMATLSHGERRVDTGAATRYGAAKRRPARLHQRALITGAAWRQPAIKARPSGAAGWYKLWGAAADDRIGELGPQILVQICRAAWTWWRRAVVPS